MKKIICITVMLTEMGYTGFLEGVSAANNVLREDRLQRQQYMQVLQQQEMLVLKQERMRQQRLLNEAQIREIDARTQRIQRRKSSIKNSVVHHTNTRPSNTYQMSGINYREYVIRSNGESCKVIYDEDNNIYSTTCLHLTNSKGIRILCTKHKKICKTEYELVSSEGINNSNYFTTEKGTSFRVTYNKNGATLKSKSFTIYLDKICNATSPEFGSGIWRDGRHMGFSIQFNNKVIIFSRQQLFIENNAKCI